MLEKVEQEKKLAALAPNENINLLQKLYDHGDEYSDRKLVDGKMLYALIASLVEAPGDSKLPREALDLPSLSVQNLRKVGFNPWQTRNLIAFLRGESDEALCWE